MEKNKDKGLNEKTTVTTTIKVFRKDGSLKEKKVIKDDLLLDNFIKYLQATTGINPTLTATDGSTTTLDMRVYFPDPSSDSTAEWCPTQRIAVGTGTTGPSRSDYDMESQVDSTTEVSKKEETTRVTWSATMTLASAYDITEAGFFAKVACPLDLTNPSYTWFLFIREVFSAISVAAGESISIAFEVQF